VLCSVTGYNESHNGFFKTLVDMCVWQACPTRHGSTSECLLPST